MCQNRRSLKPPCRRRRGRRATPQRIVARTWSRRRPCHLTPPHFWALAVRYRDDYAAANVPMLPVVASLRRTTLEILVYTIVLWAFSLLVGPVAQLGWIYAVGALLLGAFFTYDAVGLYRLARQEKADVARAMRLFHYSITYLTALFVLMAVDVIALG
ncbi:MAG: hypothetical protein EBR99_02260 [Actinobacteria bacterium]|nr:hypothetical protein [Actinomycetota bacterium]